MIGIKKKIMGPMAGLILLIGITACENELGFSSPQQEEKQVTVSLSLGFADEGGWLYTFRDDTQQWHGAGRCFQC